jgi:hypothetical protein
VDGPLSGAVFEVFWSASGTSVWCRSICKKESRLHALMGLDSRTLALYGVIPSFMEPV